MYHNYNINCRKWISNSVANVRMYGCIVITSNYYSAWVSPHWTASRNCKAAIFGHNDGRWGGFYRKPQASLPVFSLGRPLGRPQESLASYTSQKSSYRQNVLNSVHLYFFHRWYYNSNWNILWRWWTHPRNLITPLRNLCAVTLIRLKISRRCCISYTQLSYHQWICRLVTFYLGMDCVGNKNGSVKTVILTICMPNTRVRKKCFFGVFLKLLQLFSLEKGEEHPHQQF